MLTNVAVLVWDEVTLFELGVLCEAFALDRSDDGLPTLDFAICGVEPGQVRTSLGFGMEVLHGLDRVAEADLVCVPAMNRNSTVPPSVIRVLQETVARGARVLSVCAGAFALGEAGLLDGREATTHWRYTDELAARFPLARVIPEVLYVDSGPVITSAGSAAGLDAALHLWREAYGAAAASSVARRMVVPPQRPGGQAQFISRPVPECSADSLAPLLEWIEGNLGQDLSIDMLARQTHLSTRTFARRFKDETGTTPYGWILVQRVAAAQVLLEQSDRTVEQIASEVGFGNAATLRHHFSKVRGVSPQQYRRAFSCTA